MARGASAKEREGEAGRPHPAPASGLLPRPGPCSARAYIWWAAVPGSSPVYPPRLQDRLAALCRQPAAAGVLLPREPRLAARSPPRAWF